MINNYVKQTEGMKRKLLFVNVQGSVNSSKQLLFLLILDQTDQVVMLKPEHRLAFSADLLHFQL